MAPVGHQAMLQRYVWSRYQVAAPGAKSAISDFILFSFVAYTALPVLIVYWNHSNTIYKQTGILYQVKRGQVIWGITAENVEKVTANRTEQTALSLGCW